MPELPELERARRLAERTLVGRTIRRTSVVRDDIVFEGVPPARLRRTLTGRRVLGAHRHGKHVWLELDGRPWPVFHFGMTGSFRTPWQDGPRLVSSRRKPETEWPPRFTKLRLWLDDGGELVMTNARRLGRVRLREEPSAEPPLSRLGFDPLTSLPGPAVFAALLRARRAPMKALLLDQTFAAGVGNWIADEVLYQARIDPRRPAHTLSETEARRVRTRLKAIIERAVAVDAEKSRFPRTWLFHRRWGRQAGARTSRGEAIVHVTLGGRTTAWVPAVQR